MNTNTNYLGIEFVSKAENYGIQDGHWRSGHPRL